MKKIIIIILIPIIFGCSKVNNTVKNNQYVGTYKSLTEGLAEGYEPTITFNNDLTFEFRENCYDGFLTILGTYSFDDEYIYCQVTENNLDGYAGYNVKEIIFDVEEFGLLEIECSICLTQEYDEFIIIK